MWVGLIKEAKNYLMVVSGKYLCGRICISEDTAKLSLLYILDSTQALTYQSDLVGLRVLVPITARALRWLPRESKSVNRAATNMPFAALYRVFTKGQTCKGLTWHEESSD